MKSVFFNNEALQAEKFIMGETGISSIELMENAGRNSAQTILTQYPHFLQHEVVILCGKGNNAGDGFVVARYLAENGCRVKVFLLFPDSVLKGDAEINYNILVKSGMQNVSIEKNYLVLLQGNYDLSGKLVIDAIFGIGFRGKPDEFVVKVIEKANSTDNTFIIAIDTPSCLDRYDTENEMIFADETHSMGSYKFDTLFQKGKLASGEIKLLSIGVGDGMFEKFNTRKTFITESEIVTKVIPKRGVLANKYKTGKVLVIAGSKGYSGAAILSSNAAMRMGSGAVISAFPGEIESAMETNLIEQVKLTLDHNNGNMFDRIHEKLDWADAVLIGPGIGISSVSRKLVEFVVKNSPAKLVIDGDALNYVNNDLLQSCKSEIILTPHSGEFAKLLGVSVEKLNKDFYFLSKKYSMDNNIILVLKNAPTLITDGEQTFINPTGRENLATFGSGDVLSGMIVSILSRSEDPFGSAVTGCYLHGLCGDELFQRTGPTSTMASDLINILPDIKNRFGI